MGTLFLPVLRRWQRGCEAPSIPLSGGQRRACELAAICRENQRSLTAVRFPGTQASIAAGGQSRIYFQVSDVGRMTIKFVTKDDVQGKEWTFGNAREREMKDVTTTTALWRPPTLSTKNGTHSYLNENSHSEFLCL